MQNFVSGSYKVNQRKKEQTDTRTSWHTFMFVSHCRYKVFRKQSTIDACTKGFKELEAYGFEFDEIGFGGTHVHGMINIPKKYSFQNAEIMIKNHSAARIFAEKPTSTNSIQMATSGAGMNTTNLLVRTEKRQSTTSRTNRNTTTSRSLTMSKKLF